MPRRRDDDFMDVDSESDISIQNDDDDDVGTRKGKGKGRAGGKTKRDRGKAKAKDTVGIPLPTSIPIKGRHQTSKRTHGKRRIRDLGKRYKRTKQGVCRAQSRNG